MWKKLKLTGSFRLSFSFTFDTKYAIIITIVYRKICFVIFEIIKLFFILLALEIMHLC